MWRLGKAAMNPEQPVYQAATLLEVVCVHV